MSNFSERLRTERLRLGLNQAEFAAIGGVQKWSQVQYEKGAISPTASYLEAIAVHGVDVLYVLTGQRMPGNLSEPPTYAPGLSTDERELIDLARRAPEVLPVIKKAITGSVAVREALDELVAGATATATVLKGDGVTT